LRQTNESAWLEGWEQPLSALFLLGFLEFLQYEGFLAYLRVKAGFPVCQLTNTKAERAGKEVQI
jgi:hypothetical protein